MSEYQYYEFLAIDRPLGAADRETLRELSTRARITATSFTNHYEWGDFKGDPRRLIERWFDLKAIATEDDTLADFIHRLEGIRDRHARKERFLERLKGLDER